MQWLINGAADGALICVLALAFMVVYSTTGIFYVALGAIYSFAPFVALALMRAGLAWPLAFIAAMIVAAAASASIEATLHWPLERRHSSPAAHVITSLGANIVGVQLLVLAWGNEIRAFAIAPPVRITMLGISIAVPQMEALVTSALIFATVGVWMARARSAAAFRALAANPEELVLTGTNTRILRLAAFALAGALAAVVSYLRAFDNGFDATSGLAAVVLAFTALVIGGRDSVWGALLGGLLLGVLRAAIAWFGTARLQDPLTFFVFGLFLLFWPTGLLGRRSRIEADQW